MIHSLATEKTVRRPNINVRLITVSSAFLVVVTTIVTFAVRDSENKIPEQTRFGSDVLDLQHKQKLDLKTETRLSGRITINHRMPMPRGVVVAYPANNLMQAVASSEIDRSGHFKMDDIISGPVALAIKPKLSSDPNELYLLMGFPNAKPPAKRSGGSNQPSGVKDEIAAWLTRKPSAAQFEKMEFSKCTPEMERLPIVQWLITGAYLNYGSLLTDTRKLMCEVQEGDNFVHLDLKVP